MRTDNWDIFYTKRFGGNGRAVEPSQSLYNDRVPVRICLRGARQQEGFMADDDRTKTHPQAADRVNVHETYEVVYWCRKFGCTSEKLRAAVAKVGTSASAVERELQRR